MCNRPLWDPGQALQAKHEEDYDEGQGSERQRHKTIISLVNRIARIFARMFAVLCIIRM